MQFISKQSNPFDFSLPSADQTDYVDLLAGIVSASPLSGLVANVSSQFWTLFTELASDSTLFDTIIRFCQEDVGEAAAAILTLRTPR